MGARDRVEVDDHVPGWVEWKGAPARVLRDDGDRCAAECFGRLTCQPHRERLAVYLVVCYVDIDDARLEHAKWLEELEQEAAEQAAVEDKETV